MAETTKDVAKVEAQSSALAIVGEEGAALLKDVREAAGAEGIGLGTLTTMKIPGAGGRFWDTPAGPMEAIEGVIVYKQPTRAYYLQSFDETGGGTPPDCFSADLINGLGKPGGECVKCPLSQFGSGPNNSQACSQVTHMFVLTKDSGVLPWYFRMPPSNYATIKDYGIIQASTGKPYYKVLTRISLVQERSGNGITYSRLKLDMVRPLTEDEAAAAAAYRAEFMPGFEAMVSRPPRRDEA